MNELKSPCIGCDFEHEDKNKERCTNCEKRIKYAEDEFMIPTEGLLVDRLAREQTKKIREMAPSGKKRGPKPKPPKEAVSIEEVEDGHQEQIADIAETQMAVDMLDLKAGEPSKRKRGRPKKEKPADRAPRSQVNFHFPYDFSGEAKELMDEVKIIAKKEFRYTNQQILLFMKQGIEKWKKEHGTS